MPKIHQRDGNRQITSSFGASYDKLMFKEFFFLNLYTDGSKIESLSDTHLTSACEVSRLSSILSSRALCFLLGGRTGTKITATYTFELNHYCEAN